MMYKLEVKQMVIVKDFTILSMPDEIQYEALQLMLYNKERVSVKDALRAIETISKIKEIHG